MEAVIKKLNLLEAKLDLIMLTVAMVADSISNPNPILDTEFDVNDEVIYSPSGNPFKLEEHIQATIKGISFDENEKISSVYIKLSTTNEVVEVLIGTLFKA